MNLKYPVKLHNRFDVIATNRLTGEKRQIAYAENIILNSLWTQLINGSNAYFQYIHFGTGSGELSAARTSLFTFLGAKAGATSTYTMNMPEGYISRTRSITLIETEYVGSTLTEVGIAYSSSSSTLMTHAQLRDMNGNPVSILKTNVDIITIYATVYFVVPVFDKARINFANDFIQSLKANGAVVSGSGGEDVLLRYVLGESTTLFEYMTWCKYLQPMLQYKSTGVYPSNVYYDSLYDPNFEAYVSPTRTNDVANKKISYYGRLPAASYNAVKEVRSIYLITWCSNGMCSPLILTMPNATYSGTPIEGETIGTGDGVTVDFATLYSYVQSGAVIKVNGVVEPNVTVDTRLPNLANISHNFKPINFCLGSMVSTSYPKYTHILCQKYAFTMSPMYGNNFDLENTKYDTLPVVSVTSNSANMLYCSNDYVNWVYLFTGSGSVPLEYQNYRYWRIAPASTNVYAGVIFNTDVDHYKETNIHFATAPAVGDLITANYTTDVLAKDENHVIDTTIEFVFSEYTS